MARVLLVDDEKNVRNGLAAIISRSGTAFDEVEECSNGRDALRMLSSRRYDLLITDVLMPDMDGIELAASLAGMAEKPYTVILSGHDDFKYAQKAIGCGVKAYLLKPVDRNELLDVLKKAEAEALARERTRSAPQGGGETSLNEKRIRLFLLNENLSAGEADREPESCGLDLAANRYRVAVLNGGEVYESEDKRERNAALVSRVKSRMAETDCQGFCFFDHKGNAVAILDVSEDVCDLAGPVEQPPGCRVRVTAGVGEPFSDLAGMRRSYLEADYALRFRLLRPECDVVRFAEIPAAEADFVLPVRRLKGIVALLGTERREELCRLVAQAFDGEALARYPLEYAEKLSNAIRNEIVEYLSERMPHKAGFIREQEEAFKSIYEFRDMREYVHFLRGYVMNINNVLLRIKHTCGATGEIDRAILYIQDNYGKDLTMAEVANRICLNYSYFSLLFKGKTGMNFVDYLKAVRIEKAKELLTNTEYKIYEISGMVGYNNTKHFTTMFRTFTGISPKEFRERVYAAN